MEQIYTIPVNEAFESSAADHALGCPFCRLYNKLEQDELDLILGASMMEPDIRLRTNEEGFCPTHFTMMLRRPKRLPLALLLESHLTEQRDNLGRGSLFMGKSGEKAAKKFTTLRDSCYICSRIGHNFNLMVETAALLWENDEAFREKTLAQPFFCLSHFGDFVTAAKARLPRREFADFYKTLAEKQGAFMDALSADVSWFVKKFDYRYEEEPWGNAKDAPERAVAFLNGRLHEEPKEK